MCYTNVYVTNFYVTHYKIRRKSFKIRNGKFIHLLLLQATYIINHKKNSERIKDKCLKYSYYHWLGINFFVLL